MAEAAGEAINPVSNIQPKHFVLVHGAGHGAWCWFKLRNLIEEAGNKVTGLDLAGAGIDLSDPSSILTFDDYNKPLFDFMSALATSILVQKDRFPMAEAAGEAINPLSNIQPKHFVLVHGAGHGAWCWFKLRNLLEEAGNKVTCVDLAGAGIDLSDPSSILTFDDYNKPLVDFMSALPDGHKVILVGHSAGGLSVCHSLQNFDDKIEVAIFVAAMMLHSGFCTEEDVKAGAPDLPEFVDACRTEFSLGSDKPSTTVAFSEDVQRELLYQLSSVEDAVLAFMLLRPPAFRALRAAKFEGKISEVKRIYIRTTYDNALKPEQQDAMIKMWPPYEVFPIDTDHSPFFSAPQQLFELIVRASASAI